MAEFLPGDVVERQGRRGIVVDTKADVYVMWNGHDQPFEGTYLPEELILVERPEGIAWDLLRQYRSDRQLYQASEIYGVVQADDYRVDNWTATFPDNTQLQYVEPHGAFAHRL